MWKHWISYTRSLWFWWNLVQHKALMRTISSREIITKKCQQQQNFDSDPKGAWHYNHVTFTPITKNFMLYCRLIYMLSMLYVRLTIKVKVGIPDSFKVGWYPHKITGSSHLKVTMTVLHVCAFAVVSFYTCLWLPIWWNRQRGMKIYCKVPQPFQLWVPEGKLT